MAQDNWEDVSDPAEMRKVLGAKAAGAAMGGGAVGASNTPKTRADAIAAFENAAALEARIAELDKLYLEGPGSTSGVAGLRDYNTFSEVNQRFDTAGDAVKAYVKSALGYTGGEGNTATEIQLNYGPYVPHSADRDGTIRDKFGRLRDLAKTARERSVSILGGMPDDNGIVTPIAAAGTPSAPPPPRGGMAATGATRNVPDPAGSALIDAGVRSGKSIDQVNAGLAAMGLPSANADQYRAAQAYHRKNPGFKGSFGDASRSVPNTARERFSASAPAAFLGGAFNGALAGIPSAVMGNQDALALQGAAHPGASTAGALLGGVAGAAVTEVGAAGALARLGMGAGRVASWAPRLGDAVYGGAMGASSSPDDPLTGGLVGTAAGVGGGMFGRNATRLAGRGLRGVVNADARYLRDRGVPITVGQAMGGIAKQIEDASTSLPGVGNVVNNTRRAGVRGFNQVAFNDAVDPLARQTVPLNVQIDATGPNGIEAVRAARSAGYDAAVNGRAATIDPRYQADYARSLTLANAIPNTGANVAAEIDATVPGYFGGNVINGPNAQAAIRELRGIRQARRTDALGNRTGQAVREAEGALTGLFDRQAPGFTNDLARANETQTNLKVLESAVSAAKNQEDNLFAPSQLNTASVQSANRLTGNGATTQRPFYRLGQAGQAVLPSRIADSGTTIRSALIGTGAVAGVGGGTGYYSGDAGTGASAAGGTLGLAALLAAGGSRPAQALAVRALLDRPDALVRIGNSIYNRSALPGMFGAGSAALLARP